MRKKESLSESSFPYRVYDRKPHSNRILPVLEDEELFNIMREILIQEGRPYPFCKRKLKQESLFHETWQIRTPASFCTLFHSLRK